MDVCEMFALGIGVLGEVAHARAVDRGAIGKIAEGYAHRLNAIFH